LAQGKFIQAAIWFVIGIFMLNLFFGKEDSRAALIATKQAEDTIP